MYGSAIIVFREILEASLVIGIVLAATRGIAGRGRWVSGGVLSGILLASLVALSARPLASAFEGMGQEVFNATVLLLAVVMLAWHHIWMAKNGAELSRNLNAMGTAIHAGAQSLYVLTFVVGIAVLREGSELVLLLYGLLASGSGTETMLLGSAVGLASGIVVGAGLYFGLLSIPSRYLFTVTGWMILLLAAGMAAQASRYLAQSDYLPDLEPLWNTSSVLPVHSVLGQFLHILIGYDPAPSLIQLVFYVLTLVIILLLSKWANRDGGAQAASTA